MGGHPTEPMTGKLIDHYRIDSLIGKGGMGEVYLAHDTRLGRQIALKLLLPELTLHTKGVRRFQQEARAASALNHPNILTIHEIGQTDDVHFIATEFVEGVTLREHMKSRRLGLPEVLDVGVQIATALSAAHTAGIAHRDIKPENVMIRRDGLVKILDFGLAKLLEPPAHVSEPEAPTRVMMNTTPGVLMGTVSYMSPEQARGIEVDGRTDIWSLGVMLYEMIGCRLPFEGSTMSHIIVSILEHEPEPLAKLSPGIPVELQRIVSRCLQKDANERYQTISDMLAELQSVKEDLYFEARLRASAATGVSGSAPAPVMPVAKSDATQLDSTGRLASRRQRTRSAIDSLAVLPLVNASPDPNMEYLSDGI
ncbi:MAG TPA: serine/threonine-protein kinase, partial [Pyrinomonadaceae bacterium]|nr:serine/threonine-protein kinase [Pyrinomonadaceae bacterium]